MPDIEQITSQINVCLQHFNRSDYAIEFDNFSRSCEPFFAELRTEDIPGTVEKLMSMAKELQKRRFGSKTRMFDFRAFLCVYLCPAAMRANEVSRSLAGAIAAEWNRSYPKQSFQTADFEEIKEGFRSKPFGFG